MAIGTGVFLSALIIAAVILYSVTKDRWSWRSFFKRFALGAAALIFIGGLAWCGFYFWKFIPRPIEKQTDYAGLKLGISQSEVMYIKGYPPTVLGDFLEDTEWKGFQAVIETSKLEKGKKVEDYKEWHYGLYQSSLNLTFADNGGLIVVECYSSDKLGRCQPIGGITDGDAEAEVVRRFGPPENSKITGVTKTLTYSKLGAYFTLEKERVYILGVNNTKYQRK